MKISRLMSTQHPDNVTSPFFANNCVLGGDDEIQEAFYVYSHLNIDEQLWDAEGKDVDNYVVEKLLSRYPAYFKKKILGKDKFLTLRVPNPEVQKMQGKILLESLNSIPRNFDIGNAFLGKDIAPVFEVVLPMCSSEKNITRTHQYYKKHIIERQNKPVMEGDKTVSDWLGNFGPSDIRVTPLFETKDAIINSAEYVEKYIKSEKIKELQRVWFARSDPALNYSSTAAVLMEKIGLLKLHDLQEKLSIDILPIIGCGAAPFRGNFNPNRIKENIRAYPSIQTFTAQSAFKYDYPLKDVLNAIDDINNTERHAPPFLDINRAQELILKMEKDYVSSLKVLAPTINLMSKYVPSRRKRKLHTGLFGYSRSAEGITLPRAIKFTASFYSLGLPPEILGMTNITSQEIDEIRHFYRSIDTDFKDSLKFLNKDNLDYFAPEIKKKVLAAIENFEVEVDEEHKQVTTDILTALKKQDVLGIQEGIVKAGRIRQFLG